MKENFLELGKDLDELLDIKEGNNQFADDSLPIYFCE